MKITLLLSILIITFFSNSCDFFEDDKENFIEAYKNILIVREQFKKDSNQAQKMINGIYEEFGYTLESFKEEYFEIAQEHPKLFYSIIDSIRERAKKELHEMSDKDESEEQEEEE